MLRTIFENPISTRSHFLTAAPVIALGNNFYKNQTSIESTYVLLHEYLHFEDYIYWPFLTMKYVWHQFIKAHILYAYRKNKIIKRESRFFDWYKKSLPHVTQLELIDDQTFKISKEFGSDILLEASALLNYLIKPANEVNKYSSKVINFLMQGIRNDKNLIHAAGVQIVLEASYQIRVRYKDTLHLDDHFLHILPALLPHAIAIRTFGYAMILNGFNADDFDYQKTQEFIMSKYDEIWNTYIEKVRSIFSDVLFNHKFDEFFRVLPLRDLSIVSYHCFLTLNSMIVSKKINELFPDNEALAVHFYAPLLNIHKVHDALNSATLKKYGVPKLWPRWTPVPIFLFDEKMFNSVRLDTNSDTDNIFRFSHSISDHKDFYSIYAWIQMLFTNSLIQSLQDGKITVDCPIWQWVYNQYKGIGKESAKATTKHLTSMCRVDMNLNIDLEPQVNELKPSKSFCSFNIKTRERKNRSKCFFHHCIELYIGKE